MTDIEQVLEELLALYGFQVKNRSNTIILTNYPNRPSRTNKLIKITGTQIKLRQWNEKEIEWNTTIVDLCDPNSINIIENWAKPTHNRLHKPPHPATNNRN